MGEKISVIIPVYNSEKYLPQCMDSVLAQTYGDMEIILVDDGSTDGSPAVCDGYAAKDSRVQVIHQQNGGAGAARNAGLDAATGDYIGFIDSDDYIEPDMYEKLYRAIQKTGADMSLCDFYYVWPDGRTDTFEPMLEETIAPRRGYELVEFAPTYWRYISLVNRLYKREIFDTVRLREGRICEDEMAVVPIFQRCRRIALIPDRLYWDVYRPNSVMTSGVSVKRLAAVEAYLGRYDFYRGKGWNRLARHALRMAYGVMWNILRRIDVRENRGAIRPWVLKVMKRQVRHLDLRAVRLGALYLYESARGAAKEVR